MIRPYNAKVLVGNWYEDRVLEEDVIKDYLERKSNGQLVSQRVPAQSLKQSPTDLTTVNDFKIHFGDRVLLKCDGTLGKESSLIAKANRNDCYLSFSGNFQTPDTVPTSGLSYPVANERTVLILQSVDGTPLGSTIKFGQPFALSTVDKSYFLHSCIRSYDRAAHVSRLQAVDFVSVYNHECDWVATCLNPKFRLEVEGTDIPANEKTVILNMKTNKALGVVTDFNNSTKFEIVAHTFLNSHKAEEDVNHWRFVTNVPSVAVPEPRY